MTQLANYYKVKLEESIKLVSSFVNSVEIEKDKKNAKRRKRKLRS